MKKGLSLGRGTLWVLVWFGFMLLYTTLDVVFWQKISHGYGKYMNLISIILCMSVYLILLMRKNDYKFNWFKNISISGILWAAGCTVLLYFLLDKGLDPIFESIFPASEESYQQTLQSLSEAPVISFIFVFITPF